VGRERNTKKAKKGVGRLALSEEKLIEAYLECPEENLTVEPYRKKDGSLGFRFVPKKKLTVHLNSEIFIRSRKLLSKKS
jgi:hypothetical protein